MRLTLKRLLAKPLRFLSDLWHSGHAWVVMWFGAYLVGEGHHGYGILLLALVIPLAMMDGSRRRDVAGLVRAVHRVARSATWLPGLSEWSRARLYDLFDAADKVAGCYQLPKEDGDSR